MPNFSYNANQKFIYQALWKYTKFEKFPRATKIHRKFCTPVCSAVARVSEAPPEISRGAPHTLLAYYYELQ